MFKLDLEEAEGQEIKLPTSIGSLKKRKQYPVVDIVDIHNFLEFQKSIYFCFIDYTKVFDCVDHNNKYMIQ